VLRIGCATACGRPWPGSLCRPWAGVYRAGRGPARWVRAARTRCLWGWPCGGYPRRIVGGEGRLVCPRPLSGVRV